MDQELETVKLNIKQTINGNFFYLSNKCPKIRLNNTTCTVSNSIIKREVTN